jgi:hypothetical protein
MGLQKIEIHSMFQKQMKNPVFKYFFKTSAPIGFLGSWSD